MCDVLLDVRYRLLLQTAAISLVVVCSFSCGPSLPDDLPSLAELMNNNNMTISQDSSRKVLRRYGKDGLLFVLDNGKPVARAKAAMFLRHFPDEVVEKALLKVIQNETDDFLRAHALCSLASVGTDAAIPVIARVAPSARSPDTDYFRYCADEALAGINSRHKR